MRRIQNLFSSHFQADGQQTTAEGHSNNDPQDVLHTEERGQASSRITPGGASPHAPQPAVSARQASPAAESSPKLTLVVCLKMPLSEGEFDTVLGQIARATGRPVEERNLLRLPAIVSDSIPETVFVHVKGDKETLDAIRKFEAVDGAYVEPEVALPRSP